jgi:hypothetical protein
MRYKIVRNSNFNTLKVHKDALNFYFFYFLPSISLCYDSQSFYDDEDWCKEARLSFEFLMVNLSIAFYWDFYKLD